MPEGQPDLRPHIYVTGTARTEKFRSVYSGPKRPVLPPLDRKAHGQSLMTQVATLKDTAAEARTAQEEAGLDADFGLQIQFRSYPGVELAFESLARERSGIELLNVRLQKDFTVATVFVPDGKLDVFEKLIREYLEQDTEPSKRHPEGRPKHQDLIETIQKIRAAAFDALWTDAKEALPRSDNESIWWEVWLPVRRDRQATLQRFRRLAAGIGFQLTPGELEFPERTVMLMQGTRRQIERSVMLLNSVAELRRAKETAEFFDSLTPQEQREWLDELLARTDFPGEDAPSACILDTGVNRGHPLLDPALHADDLHSIEPAWGVADEAGHGTEMAGLALYGDLTNALSDDAPVRLSHRLESVKLLRRDGDNAGRHHGNLTVEAVARPEVQAPHRRRVFNLAVTAKDSRDRGRPSAWSAALDRLASDWQGDGLTPRLFVIAAGNVQDNQAWLEYPASDAFEGIHDPGQAWNVLTVGAYTEKVLITERDAQNYEPIALPGSLSPFTTTSLRWVNRWPLKPDVVFEGGNAARDASGAVWMHSLSLLTTHHNPVERLFTTTNATSAATALCARMAAQLMAVYPYFWPETIRALIVHSAEWTGPMQQAFKTGSTPKEQFRRLIRHCGFGVPNLERAMWSVSNSLTLIVEEALQPFGKEPGKQPSARDMHLHQLPWPLTELEALGNIDVEMRITLSYFIEPNPAERGFKQRYRYESHGLRFNVKRPEESIDTFRARINRRVRDEEEGTSIGGSDSGWTLGTQLRHRGSIHSDTWKGTAVQLAQRGVLAVYPALGWWKTRTGLKRHEKQARYALVVSIHAPEVKTDLYETVQYLLKAEATVATSS